jgi:NADH-quinone oxidoreductase subunit E
MALAFSAEELATIETYKSRYPASKAALMSTLWLAQAKWGWLSEDVMRCVADTLGLPYSHVMGVATFYTMYFKKQMGKHHVQVCTNVSCMLRGGDDLFAKVKAKYGIGHNECTSDGSISLEEVECMGACGGAPMIAINETFHENVTEESLEKLLATLA